jgi:hypothetical protein
VLGWRTGPGRPPIMEGTAAGAGVAAGTAIGTVDVIRIATDLVLLAPIPAMTGKEMTRGETGDPGLSNGGLEIGNVRAARPTTLQPEICASVVQSLAGMGEEVVEIEAVTGIAMTEVETETVKTVMVIVDVTGEIEAVTGTVMTVMVIVAATGEIELETETATIVMVIVAAMGEIEEATVEAGGPLPLKLEIGTVTAAELTISQTRRRATVVEYQNRE